tara:strand:+ start:348 stop:1025 length:678 start_codon:yes stop_codon:yes gene_type:complete
MIRTGLKSIELNEYALSILKEAEWFIKDENYKAVILGGKDKISESDHWTGEKHRKDVMEQGDQHRGFPEQICSYSFGFQNFKVQPGYDIGKASYAAEKLKDVNELIIKNLCLRRNALFAVYPPGGFISWHNNANAPAYNLIFTWSEKGEGWFKYWDMEQQKIVVFEDKPGWQCKAGFFGPYAGDKNALCYHAAKTDCLRMTIAYTFNMDEISIGIQDMVIEDIST